ncbi:methylated-DNA--[protein]-cysteine S-methyltransferase [Georgenia subflava]|nr:methylated-DNA--[protein]-cysteine S-methyltransferase [Georgenia subflava]
MTDSPIGTLTIVGDEDGAVVAVYMAEHRNMPDPRTFGDRDDTTFPDARRQLAEYFAGRRKAFDLPLRPVGNDFQRRVWDALTRIPYGETRTYGQLATALGLSGQAVRAVGTANGKNPLSIIVPCHRVIGADGHLRGYAGGLERKRFLLDLERPDGAALF